ncbi:DNA-processing protein DprA [Pseudoduganella violaceinigra]|uniref:DNA-processing protein DprA n=1 Tax=Pseudoduganella violaceinigra TaxID=246602 RepID=UPI00040145A1|nr:DNA-processing protein DprA [Pseudoduganella violaceinigra]
MAVHATDTPHPARQDFERLAMWLRLANTPGVGRHAASRLLQHYHSPQAVFSAANLRFAVAPAHEHGAGDDAASGMSLDAARLLAGPLPARIHALAEATLAWAAQDGNHLVMLGDPDYPPTLQHIADPPLLLYAKGDPGLLRREGVAVVGARNATTQGKANARQFAHALSEAGMLVVSGLALGIDAAAHEGGLAGPGRTVAVIGTGIDRIYPRRNAALARRIAEEGCLLSEFPLAAPARPEHFPIRNRIIAGMARATLVVEAAAKSGSLITANAAVDAGRDIYVLPGSVHAPQSAGCHALIRAGGRLVATPEHLLEDLGLPLPGAAAAQSDEAGSWLLAALGHDPVGADELAARLQLAPGDMQASLLALELAGVVERLPGGAFQRLKGA